MALSLTVRNFCATQWFSSQPENCLLYLMLKALAVQERWVVLSCEALLLLSGEGSVIIVLEYQENQLSLAQARCLKGWSYFILFSLLFISNQPPVQKDIRDLLFFSCLFVSFFKWTKLQVTSVSGRQKNAFVSHAVGWQPVSEHPLFIVNGGKGSTGWPCSSCSLLPLLALGFHVGVLWCIFVLFALKIN